MTAYLFAMAVGIVVAGIVSNLWELAFEETPLPRHLFDSDPTLLTPLRVLAVVFSAPAVLLRSALWWMIEQPFIGVPLLVAGFAWSFLQGVFILTQLFGFT